MSNVYMFSTLFTVNNKEVKLKQPLDETITIHYYFETKKKYMYILDEENDLPSSNFYYIIQAAIKNPK